MGLGQLAMVGMLVVSMNSDQIRTQMGPIDLTAYVISLKRENLSHGGCLHALLEIKQKVSILHNVDAEMCTAHNSQAFKI